MAARTPIHLPRKESARAAAIERRRRPAAEDSPARRIVAAARRHFFAHGFRHVTMDDLAGELGMSKKTLYAGFPSKEALLEAVLKDKFRSVEADLARLAGKPARDAVTNLHRLLACMQHHTAEIQPPFVCDIRRAAPEMFHIVERSRRDLIRRYFGKFFAEGRRRGIIRRDIPIPVVIEILLGATEALVNPQKLAELGVAPEDAYMSVINVILKGIVTDPGRAQL